MLSTSYWLDSAPPFEGCGWESINGRADVVVVGGGLTGLSAALELSRQGAAAVVLEADSIIGQASGRNGGQCNVGVHQDFAALSASIGKERATRYYRAYESAVDTVEAIVEREAIDCSFNRCGKLKLALKPRHFEALQRSYEQLRHVDPNVEVVPKERIADEVQSEAFFGGLLQTTSASLHVGRFGVGLAEALVRGGGKVFDSSPVSSVERNGSGGYRVTTSRGNIECSDVLLATGGAPTGRAFSWFRRRIVPVGSFVIVTEPLDDATIDRLLANRRCYVTTKNIGYHFRTTPDNRLLFGGRARFANSNEQSDLKSGRLLRQALAGIFPELRDKVIDYCWGGHIDMTEDRLPRAGSVESGAYYSMGYSGHGVQMSVHMGRVLARKIAGLDAENPWEDIAWRAIPGHFGKPWFLPAVGAYYRAVDALR